MMDTTSIMKMYPRWNDKIIEGVNTISSPSVLSMKKESVGKFILMKMLE